MEQSAYYEERAKVIVSSMLICAVGLAQGYHKLCCYKLDQTQPLCRRVLFSFFVTCKSDDV